MISLGLNKSCYDYEYRCIDCDELYSPYGVCGCEHSYIDTCVLCGDPITPYNTHQLASRRFRVIHRHCIERYALLGCNCGSLVSPFGIETHRRCLASINYCENCGQRMSPYTAGKCGSFCSTECSMDFYDNDEDIDKLLDELFDES